MEAIDTTTPAWWLPAHLLSAFLAEFERSRTGERTRADGRVLVRRRRARRLEQGGRRRRAR
jgi:hypothetical protein